MGRLTKKEVSGKWQVNGISWEKLQKGETITEDVSQRLYGCLCKLKDYEDTGWDPQRIQRWMYELEDMVGHVCDDLCRYRHDTGDQEVLDRICEDCQVSACLVKFLKIREGKNVSDRQR